MSKVLIVEKHRGLKSALSKILTGMGIESVEVSNINEAHDIDLIIMGILASKSFTRTDIPTIILTSDEPPADRKNVCYIKQPFEIGKLCDTIEKFTEQQFA